jgi:predicted peptidase
MPLSKEIPMRRADGELHTSIPIRLAYRAYLPDLPAARPPLILFLHGAGARRGGLDAVASLGLPRSLEGGGQVPFAVVAPQCPENLDWSMILPALDAFVEEVVTRFDADRDRVYLTGLSMGGFGVWALASAYPQRFAAVAPICGGGRPLLDFPERLRRMVDVPVWAFHGERDEEIPVAESVKVAEALRGYGGDVRLTLYPDAGHDAWTRTYEDPALYAWFLRHTRAGRRLTQG